MNGLAATAHPLAEAVAVEAAKWPDRQVVVCPPATLIDQVTSWLIGSAVKTGGQDCHAHLSGAYTGDISAQMLAEAGCAYVLVGHSERRQYHNENSLDVRRKAATAIKTGLIPIICVGETAEERESGQAEETVYRQLSESIPDEAGLDTAGFANFLLAYEPVWAIGSGKIPASDDIARMHAYILSVTSKQTGLAADTLSLLYGGSVTAENAPAIMAIDGVSGVLVGGASLKADDFCKIIAA